MKLPFELLLLSLSTLQHTSAAPIEPQPLTLNRRSVSFSSLRGLTSISHDFSTQESFSRPTKFFHESTFSPHYDGRFADHELTDDTRIHHLRLLLKTYMKTMKRIGVRTWLMHGCLLGWWWNRKIMPWDTDIDVMVDSQGIAELGNWWNMSVHHFKSDELRMMDHSSDLRLRKSNAQEDINYQGKKYLLEINPYYTNTSTRDVLNVIDARWIDTSTGLFIDITTLHIQPIPIKPYDPDHPFAMSTPSPASSLDEDTDDLELYTKDQHAYSYSQMFPLRESTFEGADVHVPYDYEGLLIDEYSRDAIVQKWYRGWRYDEGSMEWVWDPDDVGRGGAVSASVSGD